MIRILKPKAVFRKKCTKCKCKFEFTYDEVITKTRWLVGQSFETSTITCPECSRENSVKTR